MDDDVLFLNQALLMMNRRAEAIKLFPAKRAETCTVHAVEFGFQRTPLPEAARDVAVQSGQSVIIPIAFGALALFFDTLCHDPLHFALSAGRRACINHNKVEALRMSIGS